jgi:glycosyl transferase family 2
MKLVMTLVVRDEADVVDEQIAYHLNAGVDFVLATDHDSGDGTTEILESYAQAGVLQLFRERGEMRESDWRTRMARKAATEHGADWIINTDADEFWMPRRGSIKDSLQAVPARYGIVWALTRHFVPRPDDEGFFAERMTVRLSATAPLNDPTSPYRPHAKAAHRADASIVVLFGSHNVLSTLVPLHGWYPADVLHFPFRTREQYERKGVRRARGDKPLGQYVKVYEASERGRVGDAYRSLLVDEAIMARGQADGHLVVDTRLRDALRELRQGEGNVRAAAPGTVEDDVRAVAEGTALYEANLVRAQRSIDVLDARLRPLEGRARTRVTVRRNRHTSQDLVEGRE